MARPPQAPPPRRWHLLIPLAGALGGLLALPLLLGRRLPLPIGAAQATELPDPAQAPGRRAGPAQVAVLAGGCFWGMEAIFEEIRGVQRVDTGYAGGSASSATYDQVSRGSTGHAEGIRITYDPGQVSYGELLKVFFAVAHDPTEVNRQGPDVGAQYRSAIFTADPALQRLARAYIRQLDGAGVFPRPIATQVEASDRFFPAEAYHQDFVQRNPAHPYVVVHDLPKLATFRATFPELLR
ncbi:peptide-methionine (S)-S-oxide reductase MsrA [Cyanobium sp. NIES-981]|uniref:peptide-methionine (S)-S-oxide reductase MsrA n=1 Tax=Cyanobium sp. NIES-981 TaxID=1851505 RepID=UPI0007DE0D07|nr:peptide-methionine (S)-S-oxide reductase MsrA [Cyanobium sp. NIES-981]SBO42252.1 Peptide methionine sulfoxide reductase MsrA 2 [Cyanobium sp. NIES-981]